MSWSTSRQLLYGLNHAQESVASRFCFPQRIAGDYGCSCCNRVTHGRPATHLTKRPWEPKLKRRQMPSLAGGTLILKARMVPSSLHLEHSLGLGSASDLCTCRSR